MLVRSRFSAYHGHIFAVAVLDLQVAIHQLQATDFAQHFVHCVDASLTSTGGASTSPFLVVGKSTSGRVTSQFAVPVLIYPLVMSK